MSSWPPSPSHMNSDGRGLWGSALILFLLLSAKPVKLLSCVSNLRISLLSIWRVNRVTEPLKLIRHVHEVTYLYEVKHFV